MSLSEILKTSTKQIHQEVEKKVILRIKTIKSDEDYVEVLKCFYAYFGAIEKAAEPYITSSVLPDYGERRNASYIKSDIAMLGGMADSLPVPSLPEISNSLQAMSALYVLEGSIIGGPYIVEMLKKTGVTKGFSFFSGYGEKANEKWTTFKVCLDALSRSADDIQESLNTATLTFERFGEIFEYEEPK